MATFDYNGHAYRVVPLWEFTLGDLAFLRDKFDIGGQVELENGLADVEEKAWSALLVLSIWREHKDVDAGKVDVSDVPIVTLITELNEEADKRREEEAKAKVEKGRGRPTKGSRSSRASSGPQNSE